MNFNQPNLKVFTVKNVEREAVYQHLLAICNNSQYFGIANYKYPTDHDFQRITILDAEAITHNSKKRGCGDVIGTVRLLPTGNDTTIHFVHKDASLIVLL